MEIWTDGACFQNPGPGAWAFVAVRRGEKIFHSAGFEPSTTNNRMELLAIIRALEYCVKKNINATVIKSDSEFCINVAAKWMHGWKAKGWRKNSPGKIKNLDLIKMLNELDYKVMTEYRWVRGHSGLKWNEFADHMCNKLLKSRLRSLSQQPLITRYPSKSMAIAKPDLDNLDQWDGEIRNRL